MQMLKYKFGFITLLAIILVLGMNLGFSFNAFAQDKIKIEAVGFFSHFPMKPTLTAIQDTCKKYSDKVDLTVYDETTDEGQNFLAKMGLSGHIPMELYIDGKNTFAIDGKAITFSDFVNDKWQVKDLEKAIELKLQGVDASSDTPVKPAGNSNYIFMISILISVVIIIFLVFYIIKRKNKAGRKA